MGLDQLNLALPRSLTGRGELTLSLTVDGRLANPVTITLRWFDYRKFSTSMRSLSTRSICV